MFAALTATRQRHLQTEFQGIEALIAYFNRTLAKPFKRTTLGKPLAA
jgi:hypothetical protein